MLTAHLAPTMAERVRTVCARPGLALLAAEHHPPVTTELHHLMRDGSFAVAVPVPGPTGHPTGAPAVLELADYAPLALREPVRRLIWIRGTLQPVPHSAVPQLLDMIAAEDPNPALLQIETLRSAPAADGDARYALSRLVVESVVVTDAAGAESVDVAALLGAKPDPLSRLEERWLRHLDAAHPDVIARLAARLPAPLRRGQIRPLGLDRYGMWLRVERDDGDRDVRLPFNTPVDDLAGLGRAIRILLGCPFANGLRSRR